MEPSVQRVKQKNHEGNIPWPWILRKDCQPMLCRISEFLWIRVPFILAHIELESLLVILHLSHHCVLGVWGSNCCFSFLAFKLRELYSRAVLKEPHLRSLLHTWIWFVWWDSGLWGHLIKGWEFLGPWEGVGVFACERNLNLGARTWAMLSNPQDGLWWFSPPAIDVLV